MKVTLVGVSHNGDVIRHPEVFANWDLGQKRMKELEADYLAEQDFDVWAKEETVQGSVELKDQIEQLKKDIMTPNFIAQNNLGAFGEGDDSILSDPEYDLEAADFTIKMLDLLHTRIIGGNKK
jgi:hypothetical protein